MSEGLRGGGVDGGTLVWTRALLEELVGIESPSGNAEGVTRCMHRYGEALREGGAQVEFREAAGFGVHLVAEVGAAGGGERPPLLVVGHLDTVHPVGTLARNSLREEGGRLFGPGVYDMKAGLAAFAGALEGIRSAGGPRFPLRVVVTADEEVGSGTSRRLLEEEGRRSAGALVLEPPIPGGGVKEQRKGVGHYVVTVDGVPAHAGIEPGRGASAIHELAPLIAALTKMARVDLGTTLNVGEVRGGSGANVVAAEAQVVVDVRFRTTDEGMRVDREIRALTPENPRCLYRVEGGVNRPALEPTPRSGELLARLRTHARALGVELESGGTGGASDGNLLAAVGCPVLDGLGVDGDGAHTLEEHIVLADLPFRVELYTRILSDPEFLSLPDPHP